MPNSYHRPEFDTIAFEKACPNNPAQDDHPLLLNEMQLSDLLIQIAHDIAEDDANHPERRCPETRLITLAYYFVQYQVDLNDPDGIREFMIFYRNMLIDYAPRYVDEKGAHIINVNLGELHQELNKPNPKQIVHVTAFATLPCLTSEKGADDRTNQMIHTNHSIEFHLLTTVLDAIKSILDLNVTDESFTSIVDERIALADTHIRSGTIGNGNSFDNFKDEINGDPILSKFCRRADLKLKGRIKLGGSTYRCLEPILIDQLLGMFNVVLYASYVYAVTKNPLHAFIATSRSHWMFESSGVNHIVNRLLVAAMGVHPNRSEIYLTLHRPEDMRRWDEGMALSLQPLNGCMVEHEDGNGSLIRTRFVWGPSDANVRTFNYRKYEKNAERTLKQWAEKKLKKLKKEIAGAEKKRAAEKKRSEKRAEKKRAAEKKRSNTEAMYAAESNKRAKLEDEALALLA